MVVGRTTETKTLTVTTTNASAAITAAAGSFSQDDVGRTITGTGIPAAATILSVQSGTAATLSANATAGGSPVATLGTELGASAGYSGWSPETAAEAGTYTVAANNAGTPTPDRQSNTTTGISQRSRT